MKRLWVMGVIAAFILATAFFLLSLPFAALRPHRLLLAGFLPIETITPEDLNRKHGERRLNVLLVPGHNRADYGAEFRGVREADLTLEISRHLQGMLERDGHFRVFTVRDVSTGEYAPAFASYFQHREREVISFRTRLIEGMVHALTAGRFKTRRGVGHATASASAANRLYAINKWANENGMDLVLHAHFNDYPGRRPDRPGEHSGFTIYVPDAQFSNSRASRALAEPVFRQLGRHLSVSTLPGEAQGITEDQDLIAIGANGSLDGASLLIEYGYIYEPQFARPVRGDMMRELAHQTYLGVKKYFDPNIRLAETTLLPFRWDRPLEPGTDASRDVLSLQAALRAEGVYPPPGSGFAECPLSGRFGPCTAASVARFQERYADEILAPLGLRSATGRAGPATLAKLEELYASARE